MTNPWLLVKELRDKYPVGSFVICDTFNFGTIYAQVLGHNFGGYVRVDVPDFLLGYEVHYTKIRT